MSAGHGRVIKKSDMLSTDDVSTIAMVIVDGATGHRRANQRSSRSGRVVPRECYDAIVEAETIVTTARQRAEGILLDAKQQAEQIRSEAEQRGEERAAEKFRNAWLRLQEQEHALDEAATERTIAIARILAERLIRETITIEPATVVRMAKDAVRTLWRSRRIAIHAHPDDVTSLRKDIASFDIPVDRIELVADHGLTRGSMRFVSNHGTIDAGVGAQLDRMVEVVREEYGAH